jgi:hypothetical protein
VFRNLGNETPSKIKLMKVWLGSETTYMWFQLNLTAALESSKYNVMAKKVRFMGVFLFRMAKWENQSDWLNTIAKLEYKVSLFCQT